MQKKIFENESDKEAADDIDSYTDEDEDAVVVSEVTEKYEIEKEIANFEAPELQVEDSVLVKFEIKNGKEFYVGQIFSKDPDCDKFKIKFFKCTQSTSKFFVDSHDGRHRYETAKTSAT